MKSSTTSNDQSRPEDNQDASHIGGDSQGQRDPGGLGDSNEEEGIESPEKDEENATVPEGTSPEEDDKDTITGENDESDGQIGKDSKEASNELDVGSEATKEDDENTTPSQSRTKKFQFQDIGAKSTTEPPKKPNSKETKNENERPVIKKDIGISHKEEKEPKDAGLDSGADSGEQPYEEGESEESLGDRNTSVDDGKLGGDSEGKKGKGPKSSKESKGPKTQESKDTEEFSYESKEPPETSGGKSENG